MILIPFVMLYLLGVTLVSSVAFIPSTLGIVVALCSMLWFRRRNNLDNIDFDLVAKSERGDSGVSVILFRLAFIGLPLGLGLGFDKQWALSIVELAMKQLEEDARSQNDWDRFSVLQCWLATPNAEASASQDASSIGMTESTFRVAVHRLRKQFRRIITEHIATTVEGPERVAEELDYLIRALSA